MPAIPAQGFNYDAYWTGAAMRGMPKLAAIAQRMLWLPATTADVERSFNKFRKVLDDQRHGLDPGSALSTCSTTMLKWPSRSWARDKQQVQAVQ